MFSINKISSYVHLQPVGIFLGSGRSSLFSGIRTYALFWVHMWPIPDPAQRSCRDLSLCILRPCFQHRLHTSITLNGQLAASGAGDDTAWVATGCGLPWGADASGCFVGLCGWLGPWFFSAIYLARKICKFISSYLLF